MTKAQRHLTNFLRLVNEAGSLSVLARKCGYSNTASLVQLRNRLEAQSGDEKAEGIRNNLARRLEQGMGKRKGWLDRDHSNEPTAQKTSIAQRHLDNLNILIQEAGGLGKLAQRCGYETSASLSQTKRRLADTAQGDDQAGMRQALLTRLEEGMNKPKGWMDEDHTPVVVEMPAEEAETQLPVEVEAEIETAVISKAETSDSIMPSENNDIRIATEGRFVTVTRNTSETQITVSLNLDGSGQGFFDTGVPFLEHMLDQIARHGLIDLDIRCKGDLHIDDHHTVEDIGITLGQALKLALGDKTGIRRYGHAYVPLDEALSRVVLDLSGRPGLEYNIEFTRALIGRFDVDLFSEFFHGLVNHSMMTLHIDNLRGKNAHHQAETVFKAFGRALRMAVEHDERMAGQMPSTKGTLTA